MNDAPYIPANQGNHKPTRVRTSAGQTGLTAAALLAAALCQTSWATAQPAGPTPATPMSRGTGQIAPARGVPLQHAMPGQTSDQDADSVVNIDFPGGTVAEYVAMLQKAATKPINVIMTPTLAKLKLGPISLRSASPHIAVNAMSGSQIRGEDEPAITTRSSNPNPSLTALSQSFSLDGSLNNIQMMPGGQSPGNRNTSVLTFPMASLLTPPTDLPKATVMNAEQVTQALEAVLRLAGKGQDPTILLHPQTNLLVIQGTNEQLNLATGVIQQLGADIESVQRVERVQAVQVSAAAAADARRAKRAAELNEYRKQAATRYTVAHNAYLQLDSETDTESPVLQKQKLQILQLESISAVSELSRADSAIWAFQSNVDSLPFEEAIAKLREEVASLRRELEALRREKSSK